MCVKNLLEKQNFFWSQGENQTRGGNNYLLGNKKAKETTALEIQNPPLATFGERNFDRKVCDVCMYV